MSFHTSVATEDSIAVSIKWDYLMDLSLWPETEQLRPVKLPRLTAQEQ